MELNKFQILKRKTHSTNHTTTISSACMGRGATLIGSSKSTCCNYNCIAFYSMDSTISNIDTYNSLDFIAFINQVQNKILNEETTIVTKCPSEKSMQHRVTSSICHCTTSISLSSFAKFKTLTTECSLINFSFLCS